MRIAYWKCGVFKAIDIFVLVFFLLVSTYGIIRQNQFGRAEAETKQVEAELVVPNLETEVALSIQVSDKIIDQNGKTVFEIFEKIEKPSEHPVIDQKGNLVIAKHPKLKSLFLKIKTVKPVKYTNGIKYNWQVVKIGGFLIWETKLTRFVGLVRSLSS